MILTISHCRTKEHTAFVNERERPDWPPANINLILKEWLELQRLAETSLQWLTRPWQKTFQTTVTCTQLSHNRQPWQSRGSLRYWQAVQGVPCLSPTVSWHTLQLTSYSEKNNQREVDGSPPPSVYECKSSLQYALSGSSAHLRLMRHEKWQALKGLQFNSRTPSQTKGHIPSKVVLIL